MGKKKQTNKKKPINFNCLAVFNDTIPGKVKVFWGEEEESYDELEYRRTHPSNVGGSKVC